MENKLIVGAKKRKKNWERAWYTFSAWKVVHIVDLSSMGKGVELTLFKN